MMAGTAVRNSASLTDRDDSSLPPVGRTARTPRRASPSLLHDSALCTASSTPAKTLTPLPSDQETKNSSMSTPTGTKLAVTTIDDSPAGGEVIKQDLLEIDTSDGDDTVSHIEALHIETYETHIDKTNPHQIEKEIALSQLQELEVAIKVRKVAKIDGRKIRWIEYRARKAEEEKNNNRAKPKKKGRNSRSKENRENVSVNNNNNSSKNTNSMKAEVINSPPQLVGTSNVLESMKLQFLQGTENIEGSIAVGNGDAFKPEAVQKRKSIRTRKSLNSSAENESTKYTQKSTPKKMSKSKSKNIAVIVDETPENSPQKSATKEVLNDSTEVNCKVEISPESSQNLITLSLNASEIASTPATSPVKEETPIPCARSYFKSLTKGLREIRKLENGPGGETTNSSNGSTSSPLLSSGSLSPVNAPDPKSDAESKCKLPSSSPPLLLTPSPTSKSVDSVSVSKNSTPRKSKKSLSKSVEKATFEVEDRVNGHKICQNGMPVEKGENTQLVEIKVENPDTTDGLLSPQEGNEGNTLNKRPRGRPPKRKLNLSNTEEGKITAQGKSGRKIETVVVDVHNTMNGEPQTVIPVSRPILRGKKGSPIKKPSSINQEITLASVDSSGKSSVKTLNKKSLCSENDKESVKSAAKVNSKKQVPVSKKTRSNELQQENADTLELSSESSDILSHERKVKSTKTLKVISTEVKVEEPSSSVNNCVLEGSDVSMENPQTKRKLFRKEERSLAGRVIKRADVGEVAESNPAVKRNSSLKGTLKENIGQKSGQVIKSSSLENICQSSVPDHKLQKLKSKSFKVSENLETKSCEMNETSEVNSDQSVSSVLSDISSAQPNTLLTTSKDKSMRATSDVELGVTKKGQVNRNKNQKSKEEIQVNIQTEKASKMDVATESGMKLLRKGVMPKKSLEYKSQANEIPQTRKSDEQDFIYDDKTVEVVHTSRKDKNENEKYPDVKQRRLGCDAETITTKRGKQEVNEANRQNTTTLVGVTSNPEVRGENKNEDMESKVDIEEIEIKEDFKNYKINDLVTSVDEDKASVMSTVLREAVENLSRRATSIEISNRKVVSHMETSKNLNNSESSVIDVNKGEEHKNQKKVNQIIDKSPQKAAVFIIRDKKKNSLILKEDASAGKYRERNQLKKCLDVKGSVPKSAMDFNTNTPNEKLVVVAQKESEVGLGQTNFGADGSHVSKEVTTDVSDIETEKELSNAKGSVPRGPEVSAKLFYTKAKRKNLPEIRSSISIPCGSNETDEENKIDATPGVNGESGNENRECSPNLDGSAFSESTKHESGRVTIAQSKAENMSMIDASTIIKHLTETHSAVTGGKSKEKVPRILKQLLQDEGVQNMLKSMGVEGATGSEGSSNDASIHKLRPKRPTEPMLSSSPELDGVVDALFSNTKRRKRWSEVDTLYMDEGVLNLLTSLDPHSRRAAQDDAASDTSQASSSRSIKISKSSKSLLDVSTESRKRKLSGTSTVSNTSTKSMQPPDAKKLLLDSPDAQDPYEYKSAEEVKTGEVLNSGEKFEVTQVSKKKGRPALPLSVKQKNKAIRMQLKLQRQRQLKSVNNDVPHAPDEENMNLADLQKVLLGKEKVCDTDDDDITLSELAAQSKKKETVEINSGPAPDAPDIQTTEKMVDKVIPPLKIKLASESVTISHVPSPVSRPKISTVMTHPANVISLSRLQPQSSHSQLQPKLHSSAITTLRKPQPTFVTIQPIPLQRHMQPLQLPQALPKQFVGPAGNIKPSIAELRLPVPVKTSTPAFTKLCPTSQPSAVDISVTPTTSGLSSLVRTGELCGQGRGRPRIGETLRQSQRASVRQFTNYNYRDIALRKFNNFTQIILSPSTTKMKNSFNSRVLRELCEALNILKRDDSVRMVLLTATGPTFCQGVDLTALQHPNLETRKKNAENLVRGIKDFLKTLVQFPKPIVAGVNGNAMGLGVTMLPLFDLVIASDSAEFYLPYAKLGQVPEGGATYTFPNLFGKLKSTQLFLGHKVTASKAQEMGLASEAIWPATYQQELIPKVALLATQSAQSMEATKALMNHHLITKLELSLETECRLLLQQWTSPHFAHLCKRFFESHHIHLQKPVNLPL